MELSSRDLCEFSVQQVADLLLDKLDENLESGKDYSCAKIMGKHDEQLYELVLVMRCKEDDCVETD